MPFADLLHRRSMAVLLIAYTIYTDTSYAVATVVGQLYVAEPVAEIYVGV